MPAIPVIVIGFLAIFAVGDAHKKGVLELETFPPKVHAEHLKLVHEYPQ